MPTVAGLPYADGLNQHEFAHARKQMMLHGFVTVDVWSKANDKQREILHQIELTVLSIKEEDLPHISTT